MKTTEGNKLIAEFMGYTVREDIVYKGTTPLFRTKDLNHYKEWKFLMPVVEKICLMNRENYLRTFGMISSEDGSIMVRFNLGSLHCSDSLIEATYEAVIEFINWYNQNK